MVATVDFTVYGWYQPWEPESTRCSQ